MEDNYTRKATVLKIQDGDSLVVSIDLGFNIFNNIELRLLDVYAFESKGAQKELGLKDKLELEKLLPVNSKVIIQTLKTKSGKDKKSFTRYIAKVWLPNGELLNDVLKQKPQGGTGLKK